MIAMGGGPEPGASVPLGAPKLPVISRAAVKDTGDGQARDSGTDSASIFVCGHMKYRDVKLSTVKLVAPGPIIVRPFLLSCNSPPVSTIVRPAKVVGMKIVSPGEALTTRLRSVPGPLSAGAGDKQRHGRQAMSGE